MPDSKVASINWTNRSLQNAISVKRYLLLNFSEKEVESFFALLNSFEIAVRAFPKLYPLSSSKKGIRRAVLSKVVSVFYRVKSNNVEVLAIIDNRTDLKEWM